MFRKFVSVILLVMLLAVACASPMDEGQVVDQENATTVTVFRSPT